MLKTGTITTTIRNSGESQIAAAIYAAVNEAAKWRRLFFPIPQPQPFTIELVSERRQNDMDFLLYRATFPAVPPGTDVASQVFDVTVDGALKSSTPYSKDVTNAEFEVPQDSHVKLALRYIDDGGNASSPREQEFDAKDTIAPDAPGEFGEVTLIGERVVPDA